MIGPYHLRLVERDDERDLGIWILDGWRYRPVLWLYRWSRGYRWVKARLIITCAGWGLAEWDKARVPRWSNLKVLRWLQRKRR